MSEPMRGGRETEMVRQGRGHGLTAASGFCKGRIR